MEARKIVIVTSGGQKKQVIETGAETLGQLKEALTANNIDFSDMTFFEGLSKTELKHDDSLLPRDIPRNGSTTNNLVFMLTTAQKKIKSGAMDRKEAYAKIKELGLQKECIEAYGKNFTMCKTDDLVSLINKNSKKEEPVLQKVIKQDECCCTKTEETPESIAIKRLVDALYNNDYINSDEADYIVAPLGKNNGDMSESPYSEAEIEDIISRCM